MTLAGAIERVEEAAWIVARRRFSPESIRPAQLAHAAVELSRAYTSEREPRPAVSAEHLPARLLFFTVSELAKWAAPLEELPARESLSVLDLGAGCGSATLGLLAACAAREAWPGEGRRLEVQAIDRDGDALELLSAVADELRDQPGWPALALATTRHDLARSWPGTDRRFDLILAGNLLNELPPERAGELTRQALARLTPGGRLVIIEPALRTVSRDVQALRDQLLAEGAASVLAPCTRCGPCPALLDPEDWCHQSRLWSPPPALQQLTGLSGLRRRELRYSLLVLAPAGTAGSWRPGAWRVVSDPLVSKGKRELFLCGEPGRLRAVLLNRHRSPQTEAFRDLRRGQLCWIEGAAVRAGEARSAEGRGAELRLDADSRVESEDQSSE